MALEYRKKLIFKREKSKKWKMCFNSFALVRRNFDWVFKYANFIGHTENMILARTYVVIRCTCDLWIAKKNAIKDVSIKIYFCLETSVSIWIVNTQALKTVLWLALLCSSFLKRLNE